MIRTLVLLAAGLLSFSTAEAGPGARAHRGARAISTVNMPPGWQWPPSAQMLETGRRCLADLDQLGVRYRRVHRQIGRIVTPVVVDDLTFGSLKLRHRFRNKPFVMDCHLARVLTVQGSALAAAGIRELIFGSIYDYRLARLGGRARPMLSRHALGLGIDIVGLTTASGQVRTVRRHYRRGGGLLHQAERILLSTKGFRAVVSPGNDRAHVDHFHLSARMNILGAAEDLYVDPGELLAVTAPRRRLRRRARRRRRPVAGSRQRRPAAHPLGRRPAGPRRPN